MFLNKKIIQIISEHLGVEKNKISLESDFFEDFNADRLELADLILNIQQVFNITIPEDRLGKITKVSDLVNEIEVNSDL